MAVQWTEELSTGVEEIDDQHKEMFKWTEGLLDACRQRRGRQVAGDVIRFLEEYAITHFATEEKYMFEHGYAGFRDHQAEHIEFMKNLFRIKKQLEAEGPGVQVVVLTNITVIDWLSRHIRKVDAAMGAFLKTKLSIKGGVHDEESSACCI
ncbi:MAG: bacteriohemerythrin [Nitrospirota bacterium]|nr:bacteriohemerythrin [Nitrospirota bacterium]